MMRIRHQFTLTFILLLLFTSSILGQDLASLPGIEKVPPAVKQMVFGSEVFGDVTCPLEPGADRSEVAKYKTAVASGQRVAPWQTPRGMMRADSKFNRFLVSLGYLEFDSVQRRLGDGRSFQQHFGYYTAKLRPHLSSSKLLRVARREPTRVTYANLYKANPPGLGETQGFGLVLLYRLRELLPGLPAVDQEFTTKASFIMDPRDGQWKQEGRRGVNFSDQGCREYLKLIESMPLAQSSGISSSQVRQTSVSVRGRDSPSLPTTATKVVSEPVAPKYPNARSFRLYHDHGGHFSVADQWFRCEGVLYVFDDHVQFEAQNTNDGNRHNLNVPFSSIKEVKTNRWPIQRYKAFHIKLQKSKNYNFAAPGLEPSTVVAAFPASVAK